MTPYLSPATTASSVPLQPQAFHYSFKMPCDALVRVIYHDHIAICYNPTEGDLARLGLRLLDELDQANNRPGAYNEYIHLLQNMEVVNPSTRPTIEQKNQLVPYTHIRLDHPADPVSWSALLYGTRGGFDAMLRAGISCENIMTAANIYTIDLFSRTIHAVNYSAGGQQTYRADETNIARAAWQHNRFWLPIQDDNQIPNSNHEVNPDNSNQERDYQI
jgi:hypothetical protein